MVILEKKHCQNCSRTNTHSHQNRIFFFGKKMAKICSSFHHNPFLTTTTITSTTPNNKYLYYNKDILYLKDLKLLTFNLFVSLPHFLFPLVDFYCEIKCSVVRINLVGCIILLRRFAIATPKMKRECAWTRNWPTYALNSPLLD